MSRENVETVLRAWDAFSRGDLTTVLRQLDPEIVSYTAAPLDPAEYRGHEGFLAWCENWLSAFNEFSSEVESHVDVGDATVLQVRQKATGAASGVPVERTFWFVHAFNGEKIARIGIHSTEDQALEAAGRTEEAMSRENVEIVRRIWAALNEDPPRVLLEAFAEDAEIRNPSEFPLQGPFHGHDGVHVWAREVWEVFSGVHHEVEEVIDVGDGMTVITVQRAQGRTRHMQIDTNMQWASVFTLRDGRILRAQGYMTRAEALEAAGLSE